MKFFSFCLAFSLLALASCTQNYVTPATEDALIQTEKFTFTTAIVGKWRLTGVASHPAFDKDGFVNPATEWEKRLEGTLLEFSSPSTFTETTNNGAICEGRFSQNSDGTWMANSDCGFSNTLLIFSPTEMILTSTDKLTQYRYTKD